MDLVSIIIPCFNDGNYIEESITSALNQTYKAIEIIIVDDGSDDENTINVINKINHIKIKKIRNIENKGPAYARNLAIKQALGKYILCLDADDLIEESYVEKCVEIMKKNNNVGIVYCIGKYFGTKEGEINLPKFSLSIMRERNLIFVTALFRKEDWITVGGFDEVLVKGLEDYDFWISILELNRQVVQIPQVLFAYRKKEVSRNNSIINNKNLHKETVEFIRTKHEKFFQIDK